VGDSKRVWVARDYMKCSGCRRCEIACSLSHEKMIWPEASRIRIFMLVPGVEVPHFCSQCDNYPCVDSCPVSALSVSKKTGAVLVDRKTCTGCGQCIDACPGRIPHLHPKDGYALICDLCNGDPECAKVCQAGKWNALETVRKMPLGSEKYQYKLYSRKPEDITKDLIVTLYGESGKGLI